MSEAAGTTIVAPLGTPQRPGSRWEPIIRDEAQGLVERKLPLEARAHVLDSSVAILSKTARPTDAIAQSTGLVVGYVQSGKTLSFSTVMALARDNSYQLVIVVAGTSRPLLNQSTQRLRRDLRIDSVDGPLRWRLYTNPTNTDNNRRHIQQILNDWRDDDVPSSERATVLITVMKQYRHLANLVSLVRRLDLAGVPALIIDDEADQASLNTLVAQGRQSTTYRRLLELRNSIPNHSFLQYTATPQAPLLINIIDSLSPEFVEVLEPGPDYTGGRAFFGEANNLTRPIPQDELPSEDAPLIDPPETLLEALRVFFLGVAAGLIEGRSERNPNRSMLVHPSQTTNFHQEYKRWIDSIYDEWMRVLELPEDNPDRLDLIEEFGEAYDDLSRTAINAPPFEELLRRLARALRSTTIEEVNARDGQTPNVEWYQSYGWILVGGQAMDRGFTVEGLTVTYMPRGPGIGNADTVQQRARFFGYKRQYLGYCRIYLEQDALNSFQDYVEHEEYMRAQLQQIQRNGLPLREWKRAFVLSPDLRPCRHNVLQHDYLRGNFANRWFYPATALAPTQVIQGNQEAVRRFLGALEFSEVQRDVPSEAAQAHRIRRNVPLAQVISELIVPFSVTGATDTANLIGLLLQVSNALEAHADEVCTVYHMSPGFQRQRATNQDGRINELFQGPTRIRTGEYSYPGDSAFHDVNNVTVQIHSLELRQSGVPVANEVPIIAIRLPDRMDVTWIAQSQA